VTALKTSRFCLRIPLEVGLSIKDDDFIPVLQGWIQREALSGRLIDVAFYGHIHAGPVVLLCGHEANLVIERNETGYSLLYQNKQGDGARPIGEKIAHGFETVRTAVGLLEGDPLLKGAVRAIKGRAGFLSNDRLAIPNMSEAFNAIRQELETGSTAYLGAGAKAVFVATDSRDRLTVNLISA
jgi:hypothetical protein